MCDTSLNHSHRHKKKRVSDIQVSSLGLFIGRGSGLKVRRAGKGRAFVLLEHVTLRAAPVLLPRLSLAAFSRCSDGLPDCFLNDDDERWVGQEDQSASSPTVRWWF